MTLSRFGGIPGPRGARGPMGPAGAVLDGVSVWTYGAVADGVTDATAAVQRAADSSAGNVYFPPGTYKLGAVTFSQADQVITFAPGAVLKLSAAWSLTFSGARQRVYGLDVEVATASSATGALVVTTGAGSKIVDPQFTVGFDIENCSLLKVQGARSKVYDFKLIGSGKAFKYGVDVRTVADGQVDTVVLQGLDIDVGDDGADTTYGALVYLKALRSQINDIASDSTGRSLFPDGLVIVDGVKNAMNTPKLFATAATYGVNRLDNSEFFRINGGHIQGRNNGTYQANSEGIRCGHVAGHLKAFDASITGWTNGVVIHGSHDTPTLVGCTIVNNEKYAVVVDAKIGVDNWAARGLTLTGCYLADVYGEGCVWFKSGSVEGCAITGCEIGFQEIGFYVEDTFATLEGMTVDGCMIAGGMESATPVSIFRPGANSSTIAYGSNKTQSVGAVSSGTYASKVNDYLAPTFTGGATVTGSAGLVLGSGGTKITQHLSQAFTANYASVLTAGTEYDLEFTMPGVAVGDTLHATVAVALASRPGILFSWWISAADTVYLRAYNHSGSTITSASGSVRFDCFKH